MPVRDRQFLLVLVDFDAAGAGHARNTHAAGDHRRVAGHAAARRQNALRHFHAVDVVRHGFGAHQDHRRGFRRDHRLVGREHHLSHRGAGRCRQTLGDQSQRLLRLRIEHRVQKLIELLRIHAQHRFLLVDQAFLHHVDGDLDRRRTGALAVAGLQHEELAVLHGELEILHVAIVLFQFARDLAELVVHGGHDGLQFGDILRGADAGHHVFALRVDQELAVERLLAGGRVAREAHARGRRLAQVAEHHGLHVDGGAQVVRNAVHLAIVLGAIVEPGAEHGVARHGELLHGVLRERFAGLLLHQLFVIDDDGLQVFRGQVGIELGADFLLAAVEDGVEIVLLDIQHHVAEHLDEAAIAVLREARIAAAALVRDHGLVVQAEVQDRVHHAGHGELRAGADADQQRVLGVAQFLFHALFEQLQARRASVR